MKIPTNEPPSRAAADWSDGAALQLRLAESAKALDTLAADVGAAKHVLEYDSDLRRRALARAMAAPLAGGASAAKAEAEARASESYSKEIEVLGKSHAAAERCVTDWEAKKILWETARSLLAMQRETVKMV